MHTIYMYMYLFSLTSPTAQLLWDEEGEVMEEGGGRVDGDEEGEVEELD